MLADITFLTDDDPEASGRTPLPGEQRYTLYFTLEDTRVLSLHMGRKSYKLFQDFIRQMATDDACDAALEG